MMLMLMTTMMKFVFETFYMKPLFNQTVFRAVVAPSFSTKSHWTNNILTRKHTNDINIHLLCLFESLTRSNHRAIFYILSSQNLNVFFFRFDSRQVCRKCIPFANQNYLNDSFCAFLSFKASVLSGSFPWKFKYFQNKKGKYFYIFARWFNTLEISYDSLCNSGMRQSIIQRIHLKLQLNPFSVVVLCHTFSLSE